MFVKDVPPEEWYRWSAALFAGEVTGLARDEREADLVTVRVLEIFKGPPDVQSATLRVPGRMWASCRMARPALNERVLVALNANNDTAFAPFTAAHAAALRRRTSGAPAAPDGGAPGAD